MRKISWTRIALAVALPLAASVVFIRQPILLRARYAPHVHASAARLRTDVIALTAMPRCGERGLDAPAAYIEQALRATGARVTTQLVTANRNVIATFGPAVGAPLIIGAHYDAFCPPRAQFPGADDNASGTAGLLELARLLAQTRVTRPVVLVAYANEEPPFFASAQMGSAVHAQSLRGPVAGMLCLEMIGRYTPEQPWTSWVLRLLYPSRGTFIAVAGRPRDTLLLRSVKSAMQGADEIDVESLTGPASMIRRVRPAQLLVRRRSRGDDHRHCVPAE